MSPSLRSESASPTRPGRLAGGGLVTGRQLGDHLPGYHQPVQLMLSIGELLAQYLDLAGQLSRPRRDPFRKLHPALQGVYCANRYGYRR